MNIIDNALPPNTDDKNVVPGNHYDAVRFNAMKHGILSKLGFRQK